MWLRQNISQALLYNLFYTGIKGEMIEVPFRRDTRRLPANQQFTAKISSNRDKYDRVKVIGLNALSPSLVPVSVDGHDNVPRNVFRRSEISLRKNNVVWAEMKLSKMTRESEAAPHEVFLTGGGEIDVTTSEIKFYPGPNYDFNVDDPLNVGSTGDNFMLYIYYTYPMWHDTLQEFWSKHGNSMNLLSLEGISYKSIAVPFRRNNDYIKGDGRYYFDTDESLRYKKIIGISSHSPKVDAFGLRGQLNVRESVFKRSYLTLTQNRFEYMHQIPLSSIGKNSPSVREDWLFLGGSRIDLNDCYVEFIPEPTYQLADMEDETNYEQFVFTVAYVEPGYYEELYQTYRGLKDEIVKMYHSSIRNMNANEQVFAQNIIGSLNA